VQTTARAPFVSLCSGVSIGGKRRRSGGFLDAKLSEAHKDIQVNRREQEHRFAMQVRTWVCDETTKGFR